MTTTELFTAVVCLVLFSCAAWKLWQHFNHTALNLAKTIAAVLHQSENLKAEVAQTQSLSESAQTYTLRVAERMDEIKEDMEQSRLEVRENLHNIGAEQSRALNVEQERLAEIATMRNDRRELQDRYDYLNRQKNALAEEVAFLNDAARNQKDEYRGRLSQMETQADQIHHTLSSELAQIKRQNESYVSEIHEAHQALRREEAASEELKIQLERANLHHQELENQRNIDMFANERVAALIGESERWANEYRTVRLQLQDALKALENAKRGEIELRDSIQLHKRQLEREMDEKTSARDDVQRLKERLTHDGTSQATQDQIKRLEAQLVSEHQALLEARAERDAAKKQAGAAGESAQRAMADSIDLLEAAERAKHAVKKSPQKKAETNRAAAAGASEWRPVGGGEAWEVVDKNV